MAPRKLTPTLQRRVALIGGGLTVAEVAAREGATVASIRAGIQRARSLGHQVALARSRLAARGAIRVHLPPDAEAVLTTISRDLRRTPSDVATALLREALIKHPQIARNLLDPEA